jgi:hypothetical protein
MPLDRSPALGTVPLLVVLALSASDAAPPKNTPRPTGLAIEVRKVTGSTGAASPKYVVLYRGKTLNQWVQQIKARRSRLPYQYSVQAIAALAPFDAKARAQLEKFFGDPDDGVRRIALLGFVMTGDPESVTPYAVRALDDAEPNNRRSAVVLLRPPFADPGEAVPALMSRLGAREPGPLRHGRAAGGRCDRAVSR